MTEMGYARDIRKRCEALGVWRDEFVSAQRRLAKVYVRIDAFEKEYAETGAQATVEHTNKAGATNTMRNPLLAELNTLYDQALALEKELGLTAAALRKLNDGKLPRKEPDDPLAAALGKLVAMDGRG